MSHALIEQPADRTFSVPSLLIETPPWHKVFLQNVGDQFWPRRQPSLLLTSRPGEFWPDVFVVRSLPWKKIPLSATLHLVALAVLVAIPRLWPQPAQLLNHSEFNTRDVISFSPSEYLPPLDTGGERAHIAQRGKSAYAPQTIISVPPEADNRSQTIVAPPQVKLSRQVSMPNIVAWKQLPPAVPIAATENLESRKAPLLPSSVVAPAPELKQLASQRVSLLQPSAVPPQPQLPMNTARHVDEINIGHRQVVAPAPQLSVSERRTASGIKGLDALNVVPPQPSVNVTEHRRMMVLPQSAAIAPAPNVSTAAAWQRENHLERISVVAPAPNVSRLSEHAQNQPVLSKTVDAVPPAPSMQSSNTKNNDRQLIALNLHPTVEIAPPQGNRRGTFAAGPHGTKDGPGTPDDAVSSAATTSISMSSRNHANTLPSGLHVDNPESPKQKTESGSGGGLRSGPGIQETRNQADTDHPLVASVTIPRVSGTGHPAKEAPDSSASEADRRIFAGHKFYAMALNFANLNSGGGSWIFHFAEQKDSEKGELMAPEVIREIDPAYPTELMRQNVHGTVVLYAVIQTDGSVQDVKVLESVDFRLDEYARQALSQWRFRPATKNGNPVGLTMVVKVPFRPARNLF